ncbi:MAG: hypothetical protein NC238_09040 [Dehalobacter sp.]|nr:hypothetical protein [Dehalobacter sp.]
MDPRKLFFDERFKCQCVYCGGIPFTRDHVPSKVMLDEPFPTNLPVVPACKECNNGFSADEKYLACFVECVITGSVDFASIKRDKVKRNLGEDTALASLIMASRNIDIVGNVFWVPDSKRVKNVILKLARGHVAYELNEPQLQEPEYISCIPMVENVGGAV